MFAVAITELSRASLREHVRAYRDVRMVHPDVQLTIQIRIPNGAAGTLLRAGRALAEVGVPLLVNDRLDVARVLQAELGGLPVGVHLGRGSVSVREARAALGPTTTVSVACHDEQDLLAARDAGASFALYSPIFPSPGKPAPLGLDALSRAAALVAPLPVLALGGVDFSNASSCVRAGAAGFAAIRAFLPDEETTRR